MKKLLILLLVVVLFSGCIQPIDKLSTNTTPVEDTVPEEAIVSNELVAEEIPLTAEDCPINLSECLRVCTTLNGDIIQECRDDCMSDFAACRTETYNS